MPDPRSDFSADRAWPDVDALAPTQGLPDPLVGWDGRPIESVREWREVRRPELVSLFEHYMYGKAPPPPGNLTVTVDDLDPHALGGRATWKILTVRFADRVARLPFDQHALISLMAPRPVLLTNATADTHAHPRGQFDMLRAATPVYALHGAEGLTATEFPPEHVLVDSRLGFHIRPGGHDMTAVEWDAWLDLADRHLGRPALL